MNRQRTQWTFRLLQELKASSTAFFITLTYAQDETLGNVSKVDIQLFLKRLRKHSKFRYYIISEYGPQTNRPHYHGLIFNFKASHDRFNEILVPTWGKGFTSVGDVSEASINYCTGYMFTKTNQPEGLQPNFALMSRNPGIGANYLNEFGDYHNSGNPKFFGTLQGGKKVNLPRYYADKLYTPEEKEQNKINTQFLISEKQAEEERLHVKEGDYEAYKNLQKENYKMLYEKRNTKNKKL